MLRAKGEQHDLALAAAQHELGLRRELDAPVARARATQSPEHDAELARGWTVFFDGRYYADAGDRVEHRDVLAGTYAGAHLGGSVVLDEAGAAAATAALGDRP